MKDLNASLGTNFRLEREAKLRKFLDTMQSLVGHELQKVIFVSAEDYDGMTKNEAFYLKLQKIGVELDIREYKYKNFCCGKCK